jgi:nicotinamidase-related amidase
MTAKRSACLTVDDTLLLVVDIQERLLPQIADADNVAAAATKLIRAAGVLGLPILATEQYPKGIGPTVACIRDAFPSGAFKPLEKLAFSCCSSEPAVAALAASGRTHILVVGIEAHVCVQQTVLDLLALGYLPFVCADAVGSRRPPDRDVAIERMRQAGAAVTTVESAIFELTHRAGTDQFREILKIVK